MIKQIRGAYGAQGIGTDDPQAFDYLLRWSILQGETPDGHEDHDQERHAATRAGTEQRAGGIP